MKIGDLVRYYEKLYVVVSDAKFRPGVSSKIETCWVSSRKDHLNLLYGSAIFSGLFIWSVEDHLFIKKNIKYIFYLESLFMPVLAPYQ